MTVTRSRNSTFELHTCVRSMISRCGGMFAGWGIHRELTCPICGSDIDCFCLAHGGKIYYLDCHRCWLSQNHDVRQQKNA
jgi:hypothetical protein